MTLSGLRLRYLIGAGEDDGEEGAFTVVGYDATRTPSKGVGGGYCNLFDEKGTGAYGPYLHTSDTAQQYAEGQIDPKGSGWEKNLREQFDRRKRQGCEYIELDNPDAYSITDVMGAIALAETYALKVIAKNPMLLGDEAVQYVAHPNVYGAIVEKEAGTPAKMNKLRQDAGKSTLPVWFIAFDD